MYGILAPTITYSGRRAVVDKNTGNVKVLLGGDKVKGSLYAELRWFSIQM
jgi:hypothetical protein